MPPGRVATVQPQGFLVWGAMIRTSCQLCSILLRGKERCTENKTSPGHSPCRESTDEGEIEAKCRPTWGLETSQDELEAACLYINGTLRGGRSLWAASAVSVLSFPGVVQCKLGLE